MKNDELTQEMLNAAKEYASSGMTAIETVKALRVKFGLELKVAKEIYTIAIHGISLEAYQGKLFEELEPLVDHMEKNG